MAAVSHGMNQVTHGLVRPVSRSLAQCELLHLPRTTFDLGLADQQHAGYVAALRQAGVAITVLPELPDLPDATFVEDTVVVLDEVAVLCRPGVRSREPEVGHIESAIEALRPSRRIVSPGTLEGGDVMRIGRTLFVGQSLRTNAEGIHQLEAIVSPLGYGVVRVPVHRCLHFKSGVTSPGAGMLVANPDWVDCSAFRGVEVLPVPAEEPWGANTLCVNGVVFVPASVPRTADLLEARGLRVKRLDLSELQKAESGVTCLSVLYSVRGDGREIGVGVGRSEL
jgi:dimethylargininase